MYSLSSETLISQTGSTIKNPLRISDKHGVEMDDIIPIANDYCKCCNQDPQKNRSTTYLISNWECFYVAGQRNLRLTLACDRIASVDSIGKSVQWQLSSFHIPRYQIVSHPNSFMSQKMWLMFFLQRSWTVCPCTCLTVEQS